MKWPRELTLVRHAPSAYNALREFKSRDAGYQEFSAAFTADPESDETRELALAMAQRFSLEVSDAETPLVDPEGLQPFEVGRALAEFEEISLPDVVFVSPYLRATETLRHLQRGWPELADVSVVEDERLREQEHGLVTLCNDWRVFHALHPEERRSRILHGPYWYRFPGGESVADMRERNRSWITTLIREYSEKRVLVVTHHLNIIATRANLERFGEKRFMEIDQHEKPINCGVTYYRGNPDVGEDGHLELVHSNIQLSSSPEV